MHLLVLTQLCVCMQTHATCQWCNWAEAAGQETGSHGPKILVGSGERDSHSQREWPTVSQSQWYGDTYLLNRHISAQIMREALLASVKPWLAPELLSDLSQVPQVELTFTDWPYAQTNKLFRLLDWDQAGAGGDQSRAHALYSLDKVGCSLYLRIKVRDLAAVCFCCP